MGSARLWAVLVVGLLVGGAPAESQATEEQASGADLRVDAARIEERILALGRFGQNPQGGVSRVAFGDADTEGRRYVVALMEEAGLAVRIDEAGNILGRRDGTDQSLPPILFGSHIDSVPEGGNYDGDLGVIAAIESVQVLATGSVQTRHPLVQIGFAPVDATATAAPTDEGLRRLIEESAKELGLSHVHMPSGAGHDAQEIARIAPVGMIFGPAWTGSVTPRRSSPTPRTWPTGPTSSCRRSSGSTGPGSTEPH